MKKMNLVKCITKTIISIYGIIFLSGCSSSQTFIYQDEVEMVRGNQNASIETAIPMKKAHPQVSFTYQGSILKNTQIKTKDTLEDENSLITVSNTLHQRRHSLSGSILFPCMDILAAGIDFNLSFGDITKNDSKSILNKHILETSLFIVLSGTINRVTISYKPQLTYLSVNGIYSRNYTTLNDRTFEISEKKFTIRNSLATRVNLSKHFDLFTGAQHSIQPYKLINDHLEMENGYALYGGLGININSHFSTDIFILTPLNSDISDHRTSIQTGLKITTTF